MARFTGTQCRMARAALNWVVGDLAEKAKVDPNTVRRFEGGKGALTSTVDKIFEIFEAAGVTFNDAGCVCPPSVKKS